MRALPARLVVVTDRHQSPVPLAERVAELVQAGARWIWLRDRDLAPFERRTLAVELAAITRSAGATLSVGADTDLATEVGAAGVHLRGAAEVAETRGRLGFSALIGVSAHNLAEVSAAAEADADYATLSPIFSSPSKPGYGPALGAPALVEAGRIGLPVLALGGVTAATAAICLDAGAAGVAFMGEAMRKGAALLREPELTRCLQPIR